MRNCLLLCDTAHRLTHDAAIITRLHFKTVEIVDAYDLSINDEALSQTKRELLISFLSERIVPRECTIRPNINFHPAPPRYPGRGGASLALYNGDAAYGATAHIMALKVDTGPIIASTRFKISDRDTCESIHARAERDCLNLLSDCLEVFSATGGLPPPSGETWSGHAITRKQFEQWLLLDPTDPDDFHRKLKAARHPKFPGPYVKVHGELFALCQEKNNLSAAADPAERKLRRDQD